MAVAETRHGRTSGGIDVFLTGTVADDDATCSGGNWVGVASLTMQDVGHDCCS
jgi:hypothetical protein